MCYINLINSYSCIHLCLVYFHNISKQFYLQTVSTWLKLSCMKLLVLISLLTRTLLKKVKELIKMVLYKRTEAIANSTVFSTWIVWTRILDKANERRENPKRGNKNSSTALMRVEKTRVCAFVGVCLHPNPLIQHNPACF